MSNVETLDLSRNRFSGDLPTGLLDMPAIEYLDLSRNKFSGDGLDKDDW